MTQHNDQIRLQNMLDYSREAVEIAMGKSRRDLASDRILELALVRLVEVIGEAVSKISMQCQKRYTDIPWTEIIGMRNRLIHGYDSVDLDVLWDTIEIDLPPLIEQLKEIIVK